MIPVENLVHMLAYAWRDLAHLHNFAAPTVELQNAGEVLAWLFLLECKRLLRQGLDCDYVEREEELRLPRGRIDIDRTVARMLKPTQRLACVVDEREIDVAVNQCILETLHAIHQEHGKQALLSQRCAELRDRLRGVAQVGLSAYLLRVACAQRQHPRYTAALRLAGLWFRRCLPERDGSAQSTPWPQADDVAMRMIFQEFVRGFCAQHRRAEVRLQGMTAWSEIDDPVDRVPHLFTDVSLQNSQESLVIECKFSQNCLSENRGKLRYDSQHWRQLLVYVEQTHRNTQRPCDGLLLYAQNGIPLQDPVRVWGHQLRVATLDLTQKPWQNVAAALAELIGEKWLQSRASADAA